MTMMRGGPGSRDPGQITYTNIPLMLLLSNAYDLKNYQVTGPSWLDSERFDIIAKVPPGTTKQQLNVMLQNLLAERFHLALHHDTKEMQGYELSIGKNGSKLKESSPEDTNTLAQGGPPPAMPPGPPKRDANGFAVLPGPGLVMMMEGGTKGLTARMTARAQSTSELVRMLGNQLRHPVVDKTGLTGKYDFNLEYAPDMSTMGPMGPGRGGAPEGTAGSAPVVEEWGPDMLTAVREQLGLKLESKKLPVDMLIIDRVDKVPTEN
jgi:uncharacterized protein (TIGR03435 family)